MKNDNIIAIKTFEFALSVINLTIQLKKENEFIISKQLMRSATSIGANVEEAIAAQSKKDFISKMSIASKEARETKYWLRLLDKSEITKINIEIYLTEIEHIINIITKIVKTSQESIN
ncbi:MULTISPECIES: four helix bundle protein [Flavobacterium]|uniref:four helix bundle protein n=1 Tax=Flavobacterium TaxID=237 RepID=UPI000745EA7E|nr:four helix bundle protein [Flavobacterium covae]OXA75850.1 four helix bundle protein [Flavobacterium columnare] [Flavobacterium columnare NBRC 100251 = ATCC 23463]AMA48706.1 four helix bundle protein [Flavobacterium covae]AND65158.1 four helix bundle protein [Flavobacterium covae]MCJ1805374.1 four helix bundle protein [Flavobacterium covae]MCJ1809639.1 four helix bundle protein [Flavobacterium covae]